MLKSILTIFIILIGISVQASDNFLNSIVISKTDDLSVITLRTDEITKIKKEIAAPDNIILTLKNVRQSRDMDTFYKNISDINGLIVQNKGNDLMLFIEAPNISRANIVFETPGSAPVIVNDSKSEEKVVWSVISIALLLLVMNSARKVSLDKPQLDVNEVIKEREKEMYRKFQREVATLPSISYKLKGYRKHVLKGETIRSYENRVSKFIN